jgi:acylphosphatase
MAETAKLMRIRGRVQGVFFRNWTVEQARLLGVKGWVRNRADGSVEILAAGPTDAVNALIERCRQGPPAASVTKLDIDDSDEPPPESFTKRPTS